jgi:hypothetical protein
MSSETETARRGRPRKYSNAAEKSRAYRQRVKQKLAALQALAANGAVAPPVVPGDGKPKTGKELLDALIAAGVVGMWEDRTDIGDLDSRLSARRARRVHPLEGAVRGAPPGLWLPRNLRDRGHPRPSRSRAPGEMTPASSR